MAVDVVSVLSEFVQSNSQQKDAFQQTMDSLSREAIVKAIPDVVHTNGAPNLIRLILEGLSNSSQHRNNLMLKVMVSIVTELCDSEAIPESSAIDIVHVMSMKSHELSSSDLAELVQLCLKFIQTGKNLKGKWLSFFPMIFCELGKQSRVVVDTEYMTGMEYCNELIIALCNTNVSSEDAVAFTAVLRELKIPATTLTKFVAKLCAIIPEMEPQEVPPFVYQLLFLCDQSDHLVPLQHLATYFQSKLNRYNNQNSSANASTSRADSMDIDSDIIESGSLKEILQAKATSIFHISRAAATGHPLGKEFVKFIRNRQNIPELVLLPFILEVALSLGGLPQLRDVIDLLRNVVQRSLQCNEKQRHSAWMRELMLGKEFGVQELLNTIMDQCTSEGDNIFKGFELLAFSLLEIRNAALPVRPNAAGPSNPAVNTQSASGSSSSVSEQCWHIGSNILLQMIKKFPDSARLIVQKLVERLQDFGNDYQYIATISLLVQHNPLSMLDCKVPLTALLYSMDYRSVPSAKRLYAGISPLFRSSGALRDSAFLVLRKLLHSCSEDARQVAVVGFLQILKNFRFYAATMGSSLSQSSMSSQATVDVHHNQTSNTNRAFCSELINLLQCALSHQSVVRLTLYQSLPEVVSRNPELLPECIKMLRSHLKFFVDPESVIQVEMCVAKDNANIHVVEPLGQLIQAVLQTILRSGMSDHISKEDIDAKTEDEVELGVLLLRKLANNMTQSTNDDYVFGDTQEAHAQLKIQTLASVCVALADFCLAHNATKSKQAAKVLVRMHEMHNHFNSLLGESAGKAKAKGKATKGIKAKGKENTVEGSPTKDDGPKVPKKPFDMCTLSLQNIALFISFLDETNSSTARDEEILTYFRSQPLIGFRLWVVQSALDKYHAFRNNGDIEGLSADSVAKYSGSIARGLLAHCKKARQLAEEQASALYCTALNCLHEMLHGFCKHHPTKLSRLLMAMDGMERPTTGGSLENQIGKVLKHFKELLNHLLSGRENEDLVAKAVLPVIGVLTILSDQLDPAGTHYDELLDWMQNLCKDVDCCESSTVKALMNLLLHLTMTTESSPGIMSELAKEVRLAIGTLGENNTSVKEPNKFSTINEDTAAVVLAVLISKLEKLLLVVEWAVPRIGITERGDASPIVERSIYSRLKLITHALGELVDADIRSGPNSELVLKLATSLYTTMTRVTKKQTKTILPAFRSLVRTMATQLTANLGAFISHVDDKEKDEAKGVKRKRGGDKEESAPKMIRSARSIPALTYASEQYSQAILAISKRTKEDLTFGFKLTTSRDFRIRADQVNRALESVGEEPPSSDSGSEDDEMEEHHSRNQTANESRAATGMARRARGRGRGRGKFTSAGKATGSK